MLEKEFQYYLDHQSKLVKEYNDKFIVIKDQKVIGSYDNELEAYESTKKDHKVGTFLIQHVSSGEENYTQTYHSRVSFG